MQGLQRLLEQARSPGELLRWLSQNPTKVRAHHYPVALRRLGQLLMSQPRPSPVEQATLQDLSQLIIRNCPSFDVHTIHVCLHLAVLLGEEGIGRCGCLGKSRGRQNSRGLKPLITPRFPSSGDTSPNTLDDFSLVSMVDIQVKQHLSNSRVLGSF